MNQTHQNLAIERRKAIVSALRALGVSGDVSVKRYGYFVWEIHVGGKFFGLWDLVKENFVE